GDCTDPPARRLPPPLQPTTKLIAMIGVTTDTRQRLASTCALLRRQATHPGGPPSPMILTARGHERVFSPLRAPPIAMAQQPEWIPPRHRTSPLERAGPEIGRA